MGLKLLQPKSVLLLRGALTDGQGHFTLETENEVITPSLSPSAQSFKGETSPVLFAFGCRSSVCDTQAALGWNGGRKLHLQPKIAQTNAREKFFESN